MNNTELTIITLFVDRNHLCTLPGNRWIHSRYLRNMAMQDHYYSNLLILTLAGQNASFNMHINLHYEERARQIKERALELLETIRATKKQLEELKR